MDIENTFLSYTCRCLEENEYIRYPAHELLVHPFILPDMTSSSTMPNNVAGQPSTTRQHDGK